MKKERKRNRENFQHKYKNDVEFRNKCNLRRKDKLKTNTVFKLSVRVREVIRIALKRKKFKKKSKTQEILGCTYSELRQHLENTWFKNYGTVYNNEPVHIDHIIPISSAKTEEEVIKLNHYTNLQYLTPLDNIRKSNKF